MSTNKKGPALKQVEGFIVPAAWNEENILSAIRYEPRPDDVFLVTYPKCGSTWMQQILYLIFNNGQPIPADETYNSRVPFLELVGAQTVQALKRPGVVKTHMPFNLVPYSKDVKYIYVIRNPKDCCVSYYHHVKTVPNLKFTDGCFDDFVELFITGQVPCGGYFENLLPWYVRRNEPNVLFLTYEDIKADPAASVMLIAKFLGDQYHLCLESNPDIFQNILKFSSIGYMRQEYNPLFNKIFFKDKAKDAKKTDDETSPDSDAVKFFRKGTVGDWKNYFTPSLTKKIDDWIAEKTKDTDVMNLWKNIEQEY